MVIKVTYMFVILLHLVTVANSPNLLAETSSMIMYAAKEAEDNSYFQHLNVPVYSKEYRSANGFDQDLVELFTLPGIFTGGKNECCSRSTLHGNVHEINR